MSLWTGHDTNPTRHWSTLGRWKHNNNHHHYNHSHSHKTPPRGPVKEDQEQSNQYYHKHGKNLHMTSSGVGALPADTIGTGYTDRGFHIFADPLHRRRHRRQLQLLTLRQHHARKPGAIGASGSRMGRGGFRRCPTAGVRWRRVVVAGVRARGGGGRIRHCRRRSNVNVSANKKKAFASYSPVLKRSTPPSALVKAKHL